MSDKTTAETVREIIAHHAGAIDIAKVTDEATLEGDLNLDSLDNVEILMAVEDALDISIPDESVENIKTVGSFIKAIEEIISKVS